MSVINELEIAIRRNIVRCSSFGGDAYLRCKFWETAETADGDKVRRCVNPDPCDAKVFPNWTLDNLTPMQRRRTTHNGMDFVYLEKAIKERKRA